MIILQKLAPLSNNKIGILVLTFETFFFVHSMLMDWYLAGDCRNSG